VNHLAAVVAGLLLAASDYPLHWWWLQLVAFVPFWWGLWRQRAAGRRTWTFGLCFGGTYASLTLLEVGFAPPILVAAAATLVQWSLVGALTARMLTRGAVRGPLAAAAALTLVELAIWNVVPMFGTAQCFVRPLSAAPALVAFAAYTGVAGVVFAVTAIQALLVSTLVNSSRVGALLTLAAIVGLGTTANVARWTRPLRLTECVAAAGRVVYHSADADAEDRRFVRQAVANAARSHSALGMCTLLVLPEVTLNVADREQALAFVGAEARRFGLQLAIGVWQQATGDNRIWFVDPDGTLRAEHLKSHLVPWLEDYNAGDGCPTVVDYRQTRLGGMVCQDDNFTDVSRAYGRLGVPFVAVPTNDWPAVRRFHLENSVFRAIENGYAVVRAASNGISALISPRGEVLRSRDHVAEREQARIDAADSPVWDPGPTPLHAELPLGDGMPTVYARYGDTPILLVCAALVLFSLRRRRSPA